MTLARSSEVKALETRLNAVEKAIKNIDVGDGLVVRRNKTAICIGRKDNAGGNSRNRRPNKKDVLILNFNNPNTEWVRKDDKRPVLIEELVRVRYSTSEHKIKRDYRELRFDSLGCLEAVSIVKTKDDITEITPCPCT